MRKSNDTKRKKYCPVRVARERQEKQEKRMECEWKILKLLLVFAGIFVVALPNMELVAMAVKTAVSALRSAIGSIEENAVAINYISGWWDSQSVVVTVHRMLETSLIMVAGWLISLHAERLNRKWRMPKRVVSLLGTPALLAVALTFISGLATTIQFAADAFLVKALVGLYRGNLVYFTRAFVGDLPDVVVSLTERLIGCYVLGSIAYCVAKIIDWVKGKTTAFAEVIRDEEEFYALHERIEAKKVDAEKAANKKIAGKKAVAKNVAAKKPAEDSSKGKVIPFKKKGA